MKTRVIFATVVFSLFVSSIISETTQAQTRPNPKLKIEIPKLVARVNGVDIESKYIEFRLSLIIKTVKRPLTVKEKTSGLKKINDTCPPKGERTLKDIFCKEPK